MLALAATPAGAVPLYDNGPVTDLASDGRCDSATSLACGGDGDWTFYDNFILGGDAGMTGFDYTDWFMSGSPADYIETVWSLYDADPFTSVPIASGTAVAVLTATGPPDQYRFAVSDLGVALSGGVEYWLGIRNRVGAGSTTVARVADPGRGLDAAKQADGSGIQIDLPLLENRAFVVHGMPVPEPPTALLVAAVLLALAGARWRP